MMCAMHVMGHLRMHQECRERFPRHRGLAIRHASRQVRYVRAVMHSRIAN